jgi:hypothetical protein
MGVKPKSVAYVPEHLLLMSPVCTKRNFNNRFFAISMDRIFNNTDELKELKKKTFSRPRPLSPLLRDCVRITVFVAAQMGEIEMLNSNDLRPNGRLQLQNMIMTHPPQQGEGFFLKGFTLKGNKRGGGKNTKFASCGKVKPHIVVCVCISYGSRIRTYSSGYWQLIWRRT